MRSIVWMRCCARRSAQAPPRRASPASATQLELLDNQRSQYEHAIATLVGTPAPSFAIPPAVSTAALPPIPVGLPSDLLQRRPHVASAERSMGAANARLGVARAAYYPSVLWARVSAGPTPGGRAKPP